MGIEIERKFLVNKKKLFDLISKYDIKGKYRVPTLIKADDLVHSNVFTEIDSKWYVARGLSSSFMWNRFKYACGVFIGKYDAIKFYRQ